MAFSTGENTVQKISCDLLLPCQSLLSSRPFPCHWSLINSLYSLLFTMHEMGPSVRAWRSALSEGDMLPLFFSGRIENQYCKGDEVQPPSSCWPLLLQPQSNDFFQKLKHDTVGFCPYLPNGYSFFTKIRQQLSCQLQLSLGFDGTTMTKPVLQWLKLTK